MAQPTIRTIDLKITVTGGEGHKEFNADGVLQQFGFIAPGDKSGLYAFSIVDRDGFPVDGAGGDGTDPARALVGDRPYKSGAYASDVNTFFILGADGVYLVRIKLKEIL